MEVVTVRRGDVSFEALEAPDRDRWDFWGLYASGVWEPHTFGVLDRFLHPDATYLDVGAWIGPTALYAARLCRHVTAMEPDPVAFAQLKANVEMNEMPNVRLMPAALDGTTGQVVLHAGDGGRWGSSMSSLVTDGPVTAPVLGVTLDAVVQMIGGEVPTLIKMDIEGAETRVLPQAVSLLAEWRTPCLVSLHEGWCHPNAVAALWAALDQFDTLTVLDDGAPAGFGSVLGEWN